MLKTVVGIVLLSALLAASGPAVAARIDAEERLPRHALKLKDNVYDLGVSVDPLSARPVRGRAYVHTPQEELEDATQPTCWSHIGGGIRWLRGESFLFHADNRSRLNRRDLLSVYNAALGKWEDAADGTLDGAGVEVVGTASLTAARLRADYGRPDGRNEAYFARLSGGTIAVTVVWYTLATGEIVETDQVYNDRTYRWSLTGEPGAMDFDNIATHEHGHIFGLDDVYDNPCAEVTMYGYADTGETDKRTLEAADIAGIDALY